MQQCTNVINGGSNNESTCNFQTSHEQQPLRGRLETTSHQTARGQDVPSTSQSICPSGLLDPRGIGREVLEQEVCKGTDSESTRTH